MHLYFWTPLHFNPLLFLPSITTIADTTHCLTTMDLSEELENMAANLAEELQSEPNEEEIARWQHLFSYTYSEALEQIMNQRNDYSRCSVSDDLWDLVKPKWEAQGYSREAYEHKLKKDSRLTTSVSPSQANAIYLILLQGMLDTPEKIQAAAKLPEVPPAIHASSETKTEDSLFCRIDGTTKQALETWLSHQNSTFKPLFVRVSKAKKDLAATSIHPTLGKNSTLPQHRLSFSHKTPSPTPLQDEYPVWYFFYGTLADSAILTRLLSLSEAEHPLLVPATISRGIVKKWQQKYNALVDGGSTDYVHGSAYKVTTKEREEALLLYETEMYEVVRCAIVMEIGVVGGLTFRFVGSW